MRSFAVLAIAASVVIPVFVAASPTPADAFEPRVSGPNWRRDALDRFHSGIKVGSKPEPRDINYRLREDDGKELHALRDFVSFYGFSEDDGKK
ncbi:hypothetical protein BKA93DRAFT_804066 [Sparassis latifolia]